MNAAGRHGRRLKSVLARFFGFVFLWWVLAEGNLYQAWFGGAVSVVGTAMSYRIWPRGAWRWRASRLLGFVPYFLWHSFLGGIDVARRAFTPSMPLDPHLKRFRLRFDYEPAQVFLAWVVGLFPGTASVHLHEDVLTVHILMSPGKVERSLRELESRVERLFGLEAEGS